MSLITVLGASGFVGSHLVSYLNEQNIKYNIPARDHHFHKSENLGHIIYTIGLTADFRTRPMETVKAHVCKLVEVIENANFDSLLYLSSTRVYMYNEIANEEEKLHVNPADFSDLYNISKLMGESVCLSTNNPKIRVARLSNIIGNDFNSDNLLFSLIKDAVDKNSIELGISEASAKDYIDINDVTKLLVNIALNGNQRIYNVASGNNLSIKDITQKIIDKTGCTIKYSPNAQLSSFVNISIEKIKKEFNFEPNNILNDIDKLIEIYKNTKHDTN
jgi:nucleoside-diphosphate-sugar epimerase